MFASKKKEPEDEVSASVGDYGWWQLGLTFLLSLVNLPCTWHIYVPVFQTLESEYWCARPANASMSPEAWRSSSQPSGPCSVLANVSGAPDQYKAPLEQCLEWEFSGPSSILSEWLLVCDRADLKAVAETVFLAGVAVGGLVSGLISDKYGRKKTLLISLGLQITIGTTIAYTPFFWTYLCLRCLLGLVSVSVVFSGFVLSLELVGGCWRAVVGVAYLFPVSLGYVTIAGIAWLVRDWRYLQLAVSLPGLVLFICCLFIPESPRWLQATGRAKEAQKVVNRGAAFNGLPQPRPLTIADEPSEETGPGFRALLRTRQLRINTLCLFCIWFATYLVYYGLVLNMAQLGRDVYVTTALSGVVEVPALIASVLVLLKSGRRWPLCLSLSLAGVSCLGAILAQDLADWAMTALVMVAKFAVSSSNAVMPVFTAELYPTVVRNLGVGASNAPAGVALILIPYLPLLPVVPLAVLGVAGVIGGLIVLILPETGNKPLDGAIETSSAHGPSQIPTISATIGSEKKKCEA